MSNFQRSIRNLAIFTFFSFLGAISGSFLFEAQADSPNDVPINWQTIDPPHFCTNAVRTPVPTGWIVSIQKGDSVDSIFIPDSEHRWGQVVGLEIWREAGLSSPVFTRPRTIKVPPDRLLNGAYRDDVYRNPDHINEGPR